MRPLDGWVIDICGPRQFLGKPKQNHRNALRPVYEFRTATTPGAIVRQVVPLLFYPIDELELHNINARIEVNSIPLGEAEILEKAVSECDKAMVQLKAAQTGILMPPEPKVALAA